MEQSLTRSVSKSNLGPGTGFVRVYFRDDTFKTLAITQENSTIDVCDMFAKKIQKNLRGSHFHLIEYLDGTERKLNPDEKPLLIQQNYLKKGLSFGDLKNKFICELKKETISTLQDKMRTQRRKITESFFSGNGVPKCSNKGLLLWFTLKKAEIEKIKENLDKRISLGMISEEEKDQLLGALKDIEGLKNKVRQSTNLDSDFSFSFLKELEGLKASLREQEKTMTEQPQVSEEKIPSENSRKPTQRPRTVTTPVRLSIPAEKNSFLHVKFSPSTVLKWNVSEVGEWLNKMGLEEYYESFVEESIDGFALLNLTENDLKELNVKMGHRKKILTFINNTKRSTQVLSSSNSIQKKKISPTSSTKKKDEYDDLDPLATKLSGLWVLGELDSNKKALESELQMIEDEDVSSLLSLIKYLE